MAVTAVITEPGETMHIAGYTVEMFHGWSSTFSGGDTKIVQWKWTFSDGTILFGPNVSHIFTSAGSNSVTLQVTGDAGGTNTSSPFAITTTTFSGTTYYVDSARPDDTGDGLSPATAKKTMHGVLSILTYTQGAPKKVVLNKGGTYAWNTNFPDNLHGPVIFDSYGSGAAPNVQLSTDVYIEENSGSGTNAWGYSVLFNNLALGWSLRGTFQIQLWQRGSGLVGCSVTNGKISGSGSSGFIKSHFINSSLTGANSAGYFDSHGWVSIVNSQLYGNGNDISLHHQAYLDGSFYEIRGNTFDGTGTLGCFAGAKFSGARNFVVRENEFKHNQVGMDLGGNTDDRQGQFGIIEKNYIHDNDSTVGGANISVGIWFTWSDGFIVRNNLFARHTTHDCIHLFNQNAALGAAPVSNAFIVNNVFFKNTDSDIGMATIDINNIRVKNNIFYRATASNFFINETVGSGGGYTGNNANLVSNFNLFFSSVGEGPTTSATFSQDGTSRSFSGATSWQTTAGQDANSIFTLSSDPGFSNGDAGNFHITSSSPAYNAGTTVPETYDDYDGNIRSAPFDIGPFEVVGTTQTIFPVGFNKMLRLVG